MKKVFTLSIVVSIIFIGCAESNILEVAKARVACKEHGGLSKVLVNSIRDVASCKDGTEVKWKDTTGPEVLLEYNIIEQEIKDERTNTKQ